MKNQRFLAFIIVVLTLLGGWQRTHAQTWTTGVPQDGTYYLYNVGYAGYLTDGNNWGTRASLSKTDAAAIRLEKTGNNVYTLHTSPAYPDGKVTRENGTGSAAYLDQTAGTSWTLTEVSTGVYNILADGEYFYGRDDTKTTIGSKQGNAYDNWRLLSREDYLRYLVSNASSENPIDATFLLPSHAFNKNTDGMWGDINSSMKGDDGYRFAEFWDRTFDLHQTLSNIPNGRYRIQAQGFYRLGGGDNSPSHSATERAAGKETINAYFYANNVEHPFPSIFDSECTTQNSDYNSSTGFAINGTTYYVPNNTTQAGNCFQRGDYMTTFDVIVSNNQMTLGAKCNVYDGAEWSCVKGFRLIYLGTISDKMHELGSYTLSVAPGKWSTANAPTSVTISYPNRLSTDDEKVTLKANHGITVNETAATVTCINEAVTISNLPTTAGTYTILIPAGAVGYQESGVTNSEDISLTYTIVEANISEAKSGYLYMTINDAPRFLSRGADWNTRAIVADYGLPVELSASDGDNCSKLQFLDGQGYFFANSSNEMYTDGTSENSIRVEVTDEGGYRFKTVGGRYVTVTSNKLSASTTLSSRAAVWKFMDKADYDALQSTNTAEQKSATLAAAGTTEEGVTNAYLQIVKSSSDTQTSSTTESSNEGLTRNWTFTKLEPGLYMISLNAFIRSGEVSNVQTQLSYGYDAHVAYLKANGNSIRIVSAWEAGQSEAIKSGSSSSVTVDGETRYFPNNTTAVNYAFDNLPIFNNRVLAMVGTDGKLTVTLDNPSRVPNNWMPYRDLIISKVVPDFDAWDSMDLGEINIENEDVKAFLDAAHYEYVGQKAIVANYEKKNDHPRPIIIPVKSTGGEATVTVSASSDYSDAYTTTANCSAGNITLHYNAIPGNTYYYKVENAAQGILTQGKFDVTGMVRMLYSEGGSNMRDLGGRITVDGKRVKYGRIFRGGELHQGYNTFPTANDIKELQRLGITAELDLRRHNETENGDNVPTASAIPGAKYYFPDIQHCDQDLVFNQNGWDYHNKIKQSIHFIAQNLKNNGKVYFHCIWGADRTGAWGMFIESILGCQFNDIEKDYQLTTFSKAGLRPGGLVLDDKFAAVQNIGCKGNTIQEQMVDFLTRVCGVSQADINTIRTELLEDGYEADYVAELKTAYSKIAKTAGVEWSSEATTKAALTESFNSAMQTVSEPVNLSSLLVNGNFEDDNNNWLTFGDGIGHGGASNHIGRVSNGVGSFRKTLQNMPAGTYIVKVQAFNRKGEGSGDTSNSSYKAYLEGTKATSYLKANDTRVILRNLYEDFLNTSISSGEDHNPSYKMYVPENSTSGAAVMSLDGGKLYWNVATVTLDEAGDLTIGIIAPENTTGDYTVFDNFCLYYCGKTFEPTEFNLDETAKFALKEDGIYDVTSNRTLIADQWNPVCLPFDLTAEMMEEAHITDACKMESVSYADGEADVMFAKVDEMKAGMPYIVKLSQDWNVSAQNVVVRAKTPVSVYINDTKHNYFITGTYAPTSFSRKYFLDNDRFYYATTSQPMNGYRAYITLTGLSTVKRFDIGLDEATSVETIEEVPVSKDTQVYDLQGRRISGTARHGLYIIGGKKVLVK